MPSAPPDVDLLLENSAGAGGIIGSGLEEISELLSRAGDDQRFGSLHRLLTLARERAPASR